MKFLNKLIYKIVKNYTGFMNFNKFDKLTLKEKFYYLNKWLKGQDIYWFIKNNKYLIKQIVLSIIVSVIGNLIYTFLFI